MGVGGLGVLLAACGGSSSSSTSASSAPSSSGSASASRTSNDPQTIINTAITAEALAVTYLTAVITSPHVKSTPVGRFLDVLKAANAEEYAHFKALEKLGAKPLTTRFWTPNAFFGPNLAGVFPTLQVAETLFVNAYLIGLTSFAKAGKADLARYAAEIGATESQHLALANFAAGKTPPNDVAFNDYSITSITGIVSALEQAGVGFGKQGSKPGTFATFAPPPAHAVTTVRFTSPS
jgi:hypothetical protein